MEWVRRTSAAMARAEYDHLVGVFLHSDECDMFGNIHARFSGACEFCQLDWEKLMTGRLTLDRDHHGFTTPLRWVYGCTQPWTTWTVNRHDGQAHRVLLESCSITALIR